MNNLRYLKAKEDIPFNLHEHIVPSWGKNEKGEDKFAVFLINVSLRGRSLVCADAAACMIAIPEDPIILMTVQQFLPLGQAGLFSFLCFIGDEILVQIQGGNTFHQRAPFEYGYGPKYLDLIPLRSAHIPAILIYNRNRDRIWWLFKTSYFTSVLFSHRCFWNLHPSNWIMKWHGAIRY